MLINCLAKYIHLADELQVHHTSVTRPNRKKKKHHMLVFARKTQGGRRGSPDSPERRSGAAWCGFLPIFRRRAPTRTRRPYKVRCRRMYVSRHDSLLGAENLSRSLSRNGNPSEDAQSDPVHPLPADSGVQCRAGTYFKHQTGEAKYLHSKILPTWESVIITHA